MTRHIYLPKQEPFAGKLIRVEIEWNAWLDRRPRIFGLMLNFAVVVGLVCALFSAAVFTFGG